MRNRIIALAIVTSFVLTLIAVGTATVPAQAQSSTVVCDSTLITLLYTAEHNYGFHSAMDLTTIEKGQFKPLFDSMMAGNMMPTQDAMMMSTQAAMAGNMMATQDAMMGTPAAMDSMMTALKPGVVQGENESCTKLRAEVEGYLFTKFSAMK